VDRVSGKKAEGRRRSKKTWATAWQERSCVFSYYNRNQSLSFSLSHLFSIRGDMCWGFTRSTNNKTTTASAVHSRQLSVCSRS
jgi:hypothetical protein